MENVKLIHNDEYYLKGIAYSFFFHSSDLEKVNNYFEELSHDYNRAFFVRNESAYTLIDYRIPLNAETRIFRYGYVCDVSENIYSIEMNIIQISEEYFIALMIFYTSEQFQKKIKALTNSNIFEEVNKKKLKYLKSYLQHIEINFIKEKGAIFFNRLRKFEKDLKNEVLGILSRFSLYSIENSIFTDIYTLKMKSIKAEKEFLKGVEAYSDYQCKNRINKEDCCIVTSLYDLSLNKILVPQRIEQSEKYKFCKSYFSIIQNSLLFISFLSFIVKSRQYIDSVSINHKKDIDYKDTIIQLDKYKSLFMHLKNLRIIKENEYFKLNNTNISFIEDLNDLLTKISNKQQSLELYFSRSNLKTVEKVNKRLLVFSALSLLVAVAGVLVSYFNLHYKNANEEKERIIIIKE